MRDCRLECVQAVIERQKRMPAEANDDRLFLDRQHRRSRLLWSRPSVHDRAARLPLAHRLLIDAVTSGERSQALFTMLYRSTDRLSRRGAPVKNLAHSASFDSCHKNAPSKCGAYQHPSNDRYVALGGRATISEEIAEMRTMWSSDLDKHFPPGF